MIPVSLHLILYTPGKNVSDVREMLHVKYEKFVEQVNKNFMVNWKVLGRYETSTVWKCTCVSKDVQHVL